jgi:formyl-CoA transferase
MDLIAGDGRGHERDRVADRPPVKAGPAICDFFGGVHLYGAVMTTLSSEHHQRGAVGRSVDAGGRIYVVEPASAFFGQDRNFRCAPAIAGGLAGRLQRLPTVDGYIAIICVGETH